MATALLGHQGDLLHRLAVHQDGEVPQLLPFRHRGRHLPRQVQGGGDLPRRPFVQEQLALPGQDGLDALLRAQGDGHRVQGSDGAAVTRA